MSTLTLGRAGLHVTIDTADEWSLSGDDVSLSGWLHASSVANAKALRQQLSGHIGEVIPVTWSEDSSVDGFYELTAATVSTVPASLVVGTFEFTASLRRVLRYAMPLVESRLGGTLRANAHSILIGSSTPWHAVPAAAEMYDRAGDATTTYSTRTSSSGVLNIWAPASQALYGATATWRIAPADWFDSSAVVSVDSQVATGKQMVNTPTNWELYNDLLRIGPNGATSLFDIQAYDGAAWVPSTATAIEVGFWDGAWNEVTDIVAVEVLRSRPEECVLRLACAAVDAASTSFGVNVDLALRRGARLCRMVISSEASLKWGITADTGDWTDDTSGIYETSNNADGDRFVAYTSKANDVVTADQRIYLTSAGTVIDIGFGYEIGGSGSVAPDRKADLKAHYFAAQREVTEVVA